MHQGGGEAKTPGGWEALMAKDLVGPHINVVHGNNLTDQQLKAFVERGVSFSITPENEMAQGHGHPITGRLRALGTAPSVGVDLESAVSGDMFTVARMALASQRALDNAAERAKSGGIPPTCMRMRVANAWASRLVFSSATWLGKSSRFSSPCLVHAR